jgi:hypothetical protein
MRRKSAVVAWSVVAAAAGWGAAAARGAVIFTEDFESGLSAWTGSSTNNVTPSTSAAPTLRGNNSFVVPDGSIVRIARAFTPNAAATSFKLTFEMYTNDVSTGTQRYYGQLTNGTATTPGTGTGGFTRLGANNASPAVYQFLYSNGSTQTVSTTRTLSVGWHTVVLTVTPGAAGVGTEAYDIDNGADSATITNSAAVAIPTVVSFGQTVSNGVAGAPDTSAWFDTVKVEQFAPGAAKPTQSGGPANGATGVDPSVATLLSWAAAANDVNYDVLFGTSPTPSTTVSPNQTGTSYNAGTLAGSTTYYWQIVPKNILGDAGTSSDVFSFTTAAAPEPASLGVLAAGTVLLLGRRRRQR